jgi:predicted dehydrogenase
MAVKKSGYPAASRRLRLGMVGGGREGLVGQWHWIGARISNRWELVAAAPSSDPDAALASGRAWLLDEGRIYADWRDMARAEAERADGIDAVAICTPNWTHFEIAIAFLEAGIDVICDKPMTNDLGEAVKLLEMQKETGLVLAVTYPYVFHPMVRQARAMLAAGAIGELRQVMVEYVQEQAALPADPKARKTAWKADPRKTGRAAIAGDIGTHALHLLEFVAGEKVARLRADLHVCGAPKATEDTAFLNLAMEGGAPGVMWVTQAAAGNYCGLRIRLYGETGGLEWDQENPEKLRYTRVGQPEQTIVRGHGAGMLPEAERMVLLPRGHGEALSDAWGNLYTEIAVAVEARRGGRTVAENDLVMPDVRDGARGVAFVHAAADSHEGGGVWVELRDQY